MSAVGSCRGLRSAVSVQGDGLGPGVARVVAPARPPGPEVTPRRRLGLGPVASSVLQDSDCVAVALGFRFSDPPP